ncbi:MAG: hypothetical protein KJZ47_04845 [Gemmatimonadales bacterium]|nr:hypothetical protein [Gemmatimonadales bacterium]
MQPDYGAYLYAQGYSEAVDLILYDVPIDHVSLTDMPSLTTMVSKRVAGVDFAMSLDFGEGADVELLARAPEGTMDRLQVAAEASTIAGRTVDIDPPVKVTIRARLGPLQKSRTEVFAPLVVHGIK